MSTAHTLTDADVQLLLRSLFEFWAREMFSAYLTA